MKNYKVPKGYKLVKVVKPKVDGLKWWTAKGFKVVEQNLTYTAKNGKQYKAVKGVTQDGKELLLKAIYNGSCYTSNNF